MKVLLVLVLLFIPLRLQAKTQLTLDYKVMAQVLVGDIEGDTWNTVQSASGPITGLQFFLEKAETYRLLIEVRKPHDIKGTFKIRTPTRTDGLVAPKGTDKLKIILGPQKGCNGESRCDPITINDIGNVEMMLTLEEANQVSLGVFLLRPHDEKLDLAYRPALTYKGNQILCGSTVKKGFWIFARRFHGNASPLDTISLCVKNPKGKVFCVGEKEYEIKIKARKSGLYEFTAWNATPVQSTCYVRAE